MVSISNFNVFSDFRFIKFAFSQEIRGNFNDNLTAYGYLLAISLYQVTRDRRFFCTLLRKERIQLNIGIQENHVNQIFSRNKSHHGLRA
jgi:hypothetical protein